MKKGLKTFVLAVIIAFAMATQIKAQAFEAVLTDTVGNSMTKEVIVDVGSVSDSVVISLFAEGEIDLDSLDVKLGNNYFGRYKGYRTEFTHYASSNTTYSKVLTVNLDSANTSYTANVVAIPKSALIGYNKIKLTLIAASSGNDATDPKQKAVLFYNIQ